MPLAMVKLGERVRVVSLRAGRELSARLASMGIVTGSEVKVIQNSLKGPFIVAVKDTRIMLDRGMAHKILVE